MTRVVCIADDVSWRESITTYADTDLVCLAWSEFEQSALRYAAPQTIALALMADQPDGVDQRLGLLCRSFPEGVVIELSPETSASDDQFFAQGFRKWVSAERDTALHAIGDKLSTQHRRLFEYRLSDYKSVPDWLNARFWAHPERFHL